MSKPPRKVLPHTPGWGSEAWRKAVGIDDLAQTPDQIRTERDELRAEVSRLRAEVAAVRASTITECAKMLADYTTELLDEVEQADKRGWTQIAAMLRQERSGVLNARYRICRALAVRADAVEVVAEPAENVRRDD